MDKVNRIPNIFHYFLIKLKMMTLGCGFGTEGKEIGVDFFGSIWVAQPWPTQIGSRATFLKNGHFEGQNLDFFLNSNRFCFKIAFFRDSRRAMAGVAFPKTCKKIKELFKSLFSQDSSLANFHGSPQIF